MKRLISIVLAFAMCISMLGGISFTSAATVEYAYEFCPVGIDSNLYNLDVGDSYGSYGNTALNENWVFFDENNSQNATQTKFNGLTLSGFDGGGWVAFKLRIPKAGTYSLDLTYTTHNSYNKGEVYIVPLGTDSADYFKEDYKFLDVSCNSSSSTVAEASISSTKTFATTSANEEVLFFLRRSEGYKAPVVIKRLVISGEAAAEPEPEPEPMPEYEYSFLPKDYGDVNVEFAEGAKKYDTYSDGGKNWKFFDMEDNVEAAYDATSKPRAYAGIFDYGLKFTPYAGASNNKEQWLAIKFRVPTAGEYSVKYLIGTDASYSAQGKTYILPGDANIAIDENYLSLGATSFQNAGTTEHNGNGTITATSANQEFILIFYPNANAAMAIKSFTLVREEEKPEPEPEPEPMPEYAYEFCPVGIDSNLYNLDVGDSYGSYGNTALNENWMFFDENNSQNITQTKFNGLTLSGFDGGGWVAFKLRVPTAGTYSLDLTYATHNSYNKGEVYIVPVGTSSEDYFKEDYKFMDVSCNSSSSSVSEASVASEKTLTATETNQEFIFFLRRSEGYKAPVVIKRLVLTREGGEGTEPDPEPMSEYVYSFTPAEYGTAGSDDYVKVEFAEGVKLYNTYSNAGKHWKYFDMEDNVEAAYDSTSKPRAYAGIYDYGLKFTPYPSASNNKEHWLAIKFRVPTVGEYSVKYVIGTDGTYSEQGKTYILPGDSAITIDENYLSLGATSFRDASNTEHRGTGTIVTEKNYQEFILVFYPNSNAPMAIKSFTLVRKGTEPEPEPEPVDTIKNVEFNLSKETTNPATYITTSVKALDENGAEVDLSDAEVSAASSDESVASIEKNGYIRARKVGASDITVTIIKDGFTHTATKKLTVADFPEEESFPEEISAHFLIDYTEVGNDNRIVVCDAEGRALGGGIKYTYEIADEEIISEKDGYFEGKKIGKTTVKVTAEFKGQTATAEVLAVVVGKNLLIRKGVNHGDFENDIYVTNNSTGIARADSFWSAGWSESRNYFTTALIRDTISDINGKPTNILKMSMDGNPTPTGNTTKLFRMQGSTGQYVDTSSNHAGFVPADKNKLYEFSGFMKSENTGSLSEAAAGTIYYYNGKDSNASALKEFRSTPWTGLSGDQPWTKFNVGPVYLNWDSATNYSMDPRFDSLVDNTKGHDIYLSHFSLHEVVLDELVFTAVGDFANAKTYDTFTTEIKAFSNTGTEIICGESKKTLPVVYSSSNEGVARVSEDGTITARGNGDCIITASLTIGDVTKTAEIPLSLSGLEVRFEGLEVTADTALNIGDSSDLKVKLYNTDGSEYSGSSKIYYESEDSSIIYVSQSGVMTAKKTGVAKIKVYAIVEDRMVEEIIEVSVADATGLVSVVIKGKTTVEKNFSTTLSAEAMHESGNAAYIPACEVKFALADETQSNILTVTEDGTVTGISEGSADVIVTISANSTTVTSDPFTVTVSPVSPKSKVFDFRLRGSGGALEATIEEDGFEINQSKTSPGVVNSGANSFRFLYYGIQSQIGSYGNTINADTAIDVFVDYDGWYDITFMGGQFASGAGVAYLYMDGAYVGEYCFFDVNNNTKEGPVAELNPMYLTRGVHTFIIRTMEKGGHSYSTNQYPAYIAIDYIEDDLSVSDGIFNIEKTTLAVGEKSDVFAEAVMSNGKKFKFGLMHGNKEDSNSNLKITSEKTNVVEYKDGKLVAKSEGEALITATVRVYGEVVNATANVTVTNELLDEISFPEGGYSLFMGEKKEIEISGILDSGREVDGKELSVSYTCKDSSIVSLTDNLIYAKAIGSTEITATATLGEKTVTAIIPVVVTEDGFSHITANAASKIMKSSSIGFDLVVRAFDNNGKELGLGNASVSYESSNPDVITIDDNGYMTPVSKGNATITAYVTMNGKSKAASVEMSVRDGKTSSTYYTAEKITAARENVTRYDWAKSMKKEAVELADKYLANIDNVYNLIHSEGIPRSYTVGYLNDPEARNCRYCGYDLYQFGQYPWLANALTRPWKVQCQNCKRVFPSNDFESFYELGLNERGEFDRDRALEKHAELFDGKTYGYGYLKNELYPELRETGLDPWKKVPITHGWDIDYELENPADVWGVDDGFGYNTGRKIGSVPEMHTYVAVFSHVGVWYTLVTKYSNPAVRTAINAFRDAYVYTGEAKYGRAGAILLDRVADLYSGFDLAPYNGTYQNSHGGGGQGKIIGCIWEANGFAEDLVTAYDAFFDIYDDPQVISYLSEKAKAFNLDNKKNSGELLRLNVENGLLNEIFEAVKKSQIAGNYGMKQGTLAKTAVVLDLEEKSQEIIDFIMQPGTSAITSCTGGNVMPQITNLVDRDGYGTESAMGYNRIWASELLNMAETLAIYEKVEKEDDILQNPKYIKMLKMQYPMIMAGARVANIGDQGGTAGVSRDFNTGILYAGYKATKDPEFAQMLYFANRESTEGLHYDIFTKNPESIKTDIERAIKEYGELDISKSMISTGYGLATLRDGVRYDDVSATTRENTLRDWWIYFGGATSHKHKDMLNLGIDTFGLNMAPDLGYPAETGGSNAAVRNQWVAGTISHNTVVVNEEYQSATTVPGTPLHFDDSGDVKVIDVDAPQVYPNYVDTYRRTLVSVDVDDSVSYAVDFFRIIGGYEHVYSFHSQSIDAKISGVDLVKQPMGTYAGAGVPYGDTTNYKKTGGYNWLENVSRAVEPGTGTFTADFRLMDYYKLLSPKDWHLKMTMLNDFELSDVSLAEGRPPEYGTNPKMLKYVLAKRTGKNLDTLFTTVFEPYIGQSAIANLERVSVTKNGNAVSESEGVAAVKVTLNNGRVDYVVYATNNSATYNIDGTFDFCGAIGVYTLDAEGNAVRTYLMDGTRLGDLTQEHAAIKGTVISFTKEPAFDNYIEIALDTPVEASELSGRLINIENDSAQNGAYLIKSATVNGTTATLNIGDVTLIRGFKDAENRDAGYIYNITNGDSFSIPLSTKTEVAPIFEKIENLTVTSGSSIRIPVKVKNESGKELTFDASKLPRGMTFDAEAMVLTWSPNSSQVGDNHIALTVSDGAMSDTIHFLVSVYGKTTGGAGGGGGSVAPSTPTTSTIPATKPEDEKEDITPSVPSDPTTPVEPETDSAVRFIDLGAHAWAKDAINALAEEGIIKGTNENTFSPAANITRADFAILLVRAFKMTSDNTENFADVTDSDYFVKELAVARNTGLVGGIGENKFAPRNNITRQDMMVIVYRALVAMEKELDTAAISAADFANVSDYAKDAVAGLVNAGLIKGKNGLVDPMANTTRAEVAVLISRILEYVKQ